MEKGFESSQSKIHTYKKWLSIGALSLTLAVNSPKSFSQKKETKQELAMNMAQKNADLLKQYFVNSFAPIVNSIDKITDIPLKVKYKNRDLAEKNNFPDSIDINPKIINGSPKKLVVVTIDDKKYNIVPYRGIKIKNMKIVPNKTLDDPKAVLTLELIGFLPWDIEISSREFAQYIYDLSRMDAGEKISIWGIHVEVIKDKQVSPIKKTPIKEMTDTNTQIQSNSAGIVKLANK